MSVGLLALRGLSYSGHPSGLLLVSGGGCPLHVTLRLLSYGRQHNKCARLLWPRCGLPSGGAPAAAVATYSPLCSAEHRRRPVSDMVVKPRDLDWRGTTLDWGRLPKHYMELSKVRLTGLVVVTAMAGYAMAPGAFSGATLALVAGGTLLTSAAANTINQWLEVPYDSQMARTAARPLVRGHVSPLHAVTLASVCVSSGVGLLYLASPLAAALGAANFLLYTAVYTPLKRVTIANTWVGAVVGGIPPLMGWAAATGSLAPGAWLLAGLLYAWQFPHFNALSWNLRKDYARAGYRIMAVSHPDLTRRVALRYSLMLAALPFVTSACDVTSWMYAVDSLPVNAYLVYLSWRFYRDRDSGTARRLTRFSYLQLTAGLILMLLAKQHYHTEPQQQPAAAGAERRGRRADWCLGEPLRERGWDLSGLLAVAEREDGERTPQEDGLSSEDAALSARDAVLLSENVDQSSHQGGAVTS